MQQIRRSRAVDEADREQLVHAPGFLPIWLSTLQVDTITDFDIYLLVGNGRTPVLFRRHQLPFSEEVRNRLLERGVERLFVESRQKRLYERYVERNLHRIVSDPNLTTSVKSEAVYASASGIVRDLVERPLDAESVGRAGAFVEDACRFMTGDRAAFRCMLHMMAFDYRIFTHSVNAMVYSVALAHRLGLEDEHTLGEFAKGVLFHDVGKSRIASTTLNCRGRLSASQWAEMQRHPEYGENILREQGIRSNLILDVVRHHHEKPSGSGYPDGLAGDDVSPFVRITSIADIFDALTTRRIYRDAMPSYSALRLMREMGPEIDGDIFRAFVHLMGNPEGD